jgi:hypothetical protein
MADSVLYEKKVVKKKDSAESVAVLEDDDGFEEFEDQGKFPLPK